MTVSDQQSGHQFDHQSDLSFDPIAYLNHPRWQEVKPGLERIRELMEALGNPQDTLSFVHVAGTNGKGSTCAMVSAITQAAGYKTGLFTSPYIVKFEERIQIDGEPIPYDELADITARVKAVADTMPEHPTEFELMTAVAFCYFAQAQCDLVVLEVGLGGRLDSTNVIAAPEVSVITPIGLDHTAVLGDSLTAIAREKAGIIKPGSRAVSALQAPLVSSALAFTCTCYYVPLVTVDPTTIQGSNSDFSYTTSNGVVYEHLHLSLSGAYQRENAALAIEVACALRENGWNISDEAIVCGLADACWIGRFQVIELDLERPVTVVVDGAHNPDGITALIAALREYRGEQHSGEYVKPVLVVGVLADKDFSTMIATLAPEVRAVYAATPSNPRALDAREVVAAFERALEQTPELMSGNVSDSTCKLAVDQSLEQMPLHTEHIRDTVPLTACDSISDALSRAIAFAQQTTPSSKKPLVLCCGSLYLVADYLSALDALI